MRIEKANNKILIQLVICGTIMLVGYLGLFSLLQSPALWYDLRPDPIRSLIPDVFKPVNEVFPVRWVALDRTHKFALIMVPVYLAVVAVITGPLLYLLKRLTRSGALNRVRRAPLLWTVFCFTLAIMVVLLFVRGLLSSDVYSNVWYARIWVEHGASPFIHPPKEFPPDPEGAIYWIGWPAQPLVYGPAWLLLAAGAYEVGQWLGGSFSAELFAFRLQVDIAHLFNAWLVWGIAGLMLTRRWSRQAQRRGKRARLRHFSLFRNRALQTRTRALWGIRRAGYGQASMFGLQLAAMLFYLWNPLLLVEFAGSGHNDVFMLTFVLLAVWLHLKGSWRLAALALGLATLTKLAAIIFVPGYLWLLLWEGIGAARKQQSGVARFAPGVWRATQGLITLAVTWVVFYLPFWEGLDTLKPLVSGPANRLYLHSLSAAAWWNSPEILANSLGVTSGREQFMDSVRHFLDGNLRVALLVLLGIIALSVTWRARTFGSMLTAWGWVAIAAIMTQGWFWPWYVSWALVVAAIAPSTRLRNATLIFSISSLLMYVEEQILSPHFKLFFDWNGVLTMGPPLVYMLFSWVIEVRRNRKAYGRYMNSAKERRSEVFGRPEPAS